MAEPLSEQLKKHKTELLVGAAGVGVGIALYLRNRSKTSSSTGTAVSTPATVVTPGTGFPGTTVATTTGTDAYNGMENQILGLQSALAGLSAAKTTAGASATASGVGTHLTTVPYTKEGFAGSGYFVKGTGGGRSAGIVQGATGGYYSTVATYTADVAALNAGQSIYYESSLGGFTPITTMAQFQKIEPTGKGGAHDTTTWSKITSPKAA